METTQSKRIALLAFLIALGGIVAYYLIARTQPKPVDYLINGVPYFGTFSGTPLTNDVESTVAMILRYWGDERLSLLSIAEIFSRSKIREGFSIEEFHKFFEQQGYEAIRFTVKEQPDLRQFISSEYNVPLVMIIRRPTPNTQWAFSFAVIIGSLETKEQLVLHHTDLGSNYLLSAKNVFKGREFSVFAIKPTAAIQNTIQGPDHSRPYPARLSIMDDLRIRELLDWWADTNILSKERRRLAVEGKSTTELDRRILEQWNNITEHESFQKLHPAAQVIAYAAIGMYLTRLGEYDAAIEILNDKAIPLNHDLNKPANGWPRDPVSQVAFAPPWRLLGWAYTGKGLRREADTAFQKAIETGDRTSSGYLEPEIKAILEKRR